MICQSRQIPKITCVHPNNQLRGSPCRLSEQELVFFCGEDEQELVESYSFPQILFAISSGYLPIFR